ncbi:hypothetical protein M409DRAFT_52814 [Zasmidium cellare ATCC 36951]|uniref:Uncharacterized protein n=1 Tax=Zasmidium cellare ATCC 36951 TaxID=1080233 RepID=A0A6A6CRK8_ZASCE|nr:uncharacterized protein M409DRAFT_52814 [Zasmidium cellare ATCC 36951]KAF2168808.1 hypothetical protein M409DRAFT_52814 [Zasmidium cellare ATCC 36951]
MPATTRSQTTLEEKGVSTSKPTPAKLQPNKRKAGTATTASSSSKKKKTSPDTRPSHHDASEDNEAITINRAPVLELWASCVAHSIYPSLEWSTCLSIGGAISTITAISKGRSIGTIEKPDPGKAQEKREKRREEQAELGEVEVMGFHLKLKDGAAVVGDKPKKGNEDTLKKKYGDQQYEKVKAMFDESLKAWKDKEDELNSKAFGMYEDFRPNIPTSQQGWGRKGQLRLDTIKSAVRGE